MAEIVNLRRAKKQRARGETAAIAQQQQLLHGRTKAEKHLEKLEKLHAGRVVCGAHLEPDERN